MSASVGEVAVHPRARRTTTDDAEGHQHAAVDLADRTVPISGMIDDLDGAAPRNSRPMSSAA